MLIAHSMLTEFSSLLSFWIKYQLDRSTMHPWHHKFDPDWGSNSWPPDHDRTFHVTEMPSLTTWSLVTYKSQHEQCDNVWCWCLSVCLFVCYHSHWVPLRKTTEYLLWLFQRLFIRNYLLEIWDLGVIKFWDQFDQIRPVKGILNPGNMYFMKVCVKNKNNFLI